jgi:hypothetical protein
MDTKVNEFYEKYDPDLELRIADNRYRKLRLSFIDETIKKWQSIIDNEMKNEKICGFEDFGEICDQVHEVLLFANKTVESMRQLRKKIDNDRLFNQ